MTLTDQLKQQVDRMQAGYIPRGPLMDGVFWLGNLEFTTVGGVTTITDETMPAGPIQWPFIWFEFGIGTGLFSGRSDITGGINLPRNITTVGEWAFFGCGVSGDLVFPDSFIYIGAHSFRSSGITGKMVVPKSVSFIGAYSFFSVPGITTLYTAVDSSVFANDYSYPTSITQIYYRPGTVGWTNPWNGIATAPWDNYPDPTPPA